MDGRRRPHAASAATTDGRTGGAKRAHAGTHVTSTQARVYDAFMRTHSMSQTARELGIGQIRVRECLVQYQRNLMRDAGQTPPPLKAMLRGEVVARFGVSRDLLRGRPAKHAPPPTPAVPADPADRWRERPAAPRIIAAPSHGVTRLVVTGAEGGAPVHAGFVGNLLGYARHLGAELVVLRSDHEDLGATAPELAHLEARHPLTVAERLDLRPDVPLPGVARAPLDRLERASPGRSAAFVHPVHQLVSLPRLRGQPARVQLTTGVATTGRGGDARNAPGALVIEVAADGATFARHVTGAIRDGSFHDLDVRVAGGRVTTGLPVAALVPGDIHHARIDPVVERATWGRGGGALDEGLVDRLRPRWQAMHDVCDFLARNPHDRNDPHARFARHATGTGDVRREMLAAADFLAAARRPWSEVVVVHSNHDEMLARWLRDTDHRSDPENAEFYLDRQRAMLARLRSGVGGGSFFAETLRELRDDRLAGVRFLADAESFTVAGVELGVHGHGGPDGARGSIQGLERLGIDMVVGHGHRPTAIGGIHMTGVCQLDMGYNKGPTSWAVAHVVVHEDGARQHLFMDGGRFLA